MRRLLVREIHKNMSLRKTQSPSRHVHHPFPHRARAPGWRTGQQICVCCCVGNGRVKRLDNGYCWRRSVEVLAACMARPAAFEESICDSGVRWSEGMHVIFKGHPSRSAAGTAVGLALSAFPQKNSRRGSKQTDRHVELPNRANSRPAIQRAPKRHDSAVMARRALPLCRL